MAGPQAFGAAVLFGTVGLFLVCFILYAVLQRKRHFRCPKCGKRFKVSAAQSFFAARDGVDKRMHCPECGYFGYLQDCRDEEALEEEEDNSTENAPSELEDEQTDEGERVESKQDAPAAGDPHTGPEPEKQQQDI